MGRRDALNELLEEARVRIGLRPEGFANFGGLLSKRIKRRARALGLDSIDAYRIWLETHDDEWGALDAICRVTISRLYRDTHVMDRLAREVLPRARRVWSASGSPATIRNSSSSVSFTARAATAFTSTANSRLSRFSRNSARI